jgi:LPS-assembly protein
LDFEIANNQIKTVTDTTVITRTDKTYRWNIASTGEFDFTKNTGLDYNINTVSDRNYLRDYHFQYLAYTMSKANVDYINGRSYHAMKTIRIQELEDVENEKAAVFAMPIIDSHIESKPRFFKEKLALTSNFTTINREDGLQYRRLSATPEVQAPFNLRGNLFNLGAKVQTDAYYLENNFKNIPRSNDYDSTQTTYKPEISLKWRLPLIKKTKSNSLMLEPMASFVSSSYQKSFSKLPNEDGNPSELTVSNLFINDRIAGHDRNESGERMNYGAKTSFFNKYGEFGLIAGQSFRKSDRVQDVVIKGFAQNNKSNIVGQAMYKAQKYFSILYSFQLDQSNYRNDINQVTMGLSFDKFSINSDYLLIRRTKQNAQQKEQASISTKIDLANNWKLNLMLSRDFVLGRNLSRSLAILREGCCTIFGFSVVENNQSNLIKAQKTFNITLTFKNL